MPKFKVLSGFCISAGRDVYPGEIVELTEKQADIELRNQRIAPVTDPDKPAEKPAGKKEGDK